ncbi:hypothetical protein VTO42DRAFT_3718 [Malbranchea cinnamomea]
MGRKFFCCWADEEEGSTTPNRPVEDPKDTKAEQSQATPSAGQTNGSNPNPVGIPALSTEEEKRNLFGMTTSHSSASRAHSGNRGQSEGITYASPHGLPSSQQIVVDPPAGAAPERPLNDRTGEGSSALPPASNPPPYHNWEDVVPDTALFPPPPVSAYLYSNTGNASAEDAQRAHDFCDNTPLWTPVKPSAAVYGYVQRGDLRPVVPPEYRGDLDVVGKGRWRGSTEEGNGDCVLLTGLPLYFAAEDSPLITEISKTIYFEVKLIRLRGGSETQTPALSIGYAAQPYPTWRSPGWERASVGVFSDDGCRFVNDSWGGREFTTAFKTGETVGLCMTFSLPTNGGGVAQPHTGRQSPLTVEFFFTRNGHKERGWDLHEEVDQDSGSVKGLEGDFDLYGAVGLFGGVDFEVCFDPSGWLWSPPS